MRKSEINNYKYSRRTYRYPAVFFLLLISIIVPVWYSCDMPAKEKPVEQVIRDAIDVSLQQYKFMAEKLLDQESTLPRSFADGKMVTSGIGWWCSGFFPGSLWYLYEYSHDEEILAYARHYTGLVEDVKYANSHDVGFMIYCSFGNGLRLTGDTAYNEVLHTAAHSLAKRYNSSIGLIRSWDAFPEVWQYPVIIDNMMNLELLLWSAKEFHEPLFKDICISHADRTLKEHYRSDFSCYHVVSYDTVTGLPEKKQTHQGYSDESAWSRGQAWGLYGYTLMYRETKDKKYLEHAQRIAEYLINHPRMPKDYIPYWDMDAPDIPNTFRDVSSASIMASALIELSGYADKKLSEKYLKVAEKQIRTLASPEYTAQVGENGNFILMHGVGGFPLNLEIDVPLTYADYYYLEALVRYQKIIGKEK